MTADTVRRAPSTPGGTLDEERLDEPFPSSGDRRRRRCGSTSVFVNPGGDATRTFTSFSQALDELVLARIWAGLHFRTADMQGRQLGAAVADFAAANYFQPVGNH